jgi:hypothetical protein
MASSFREDLSYLVLNNNYLLDLPNRKNTENVLVVKYSQPITNNPRFINTVSTSPIEYRNSLNYTANQYGINTDLKILSYLYFPDNEKNYQFRVTTNGTIIYPGEFNMFLNNYQYKILDNTITNKTSNIDIVKKGVYLLCLEIPYHNSNFRIQYSIDSKIWLDLDNLLISKFSLNLDKKILIDTFLLSSLNYCNQDNINNSNCTQFYKDIENMIVDGYLDKNQSNNYPTPIEGSYSPFGPWSILDSNYKDIETITPIPTNRNDFKCGKSTQRSRNRSYMPPKYGGNSNLKDNIYNDESKKSNMWFGENNQKAYPVQTETKDITCYTPNEIGIQWKNIGCTTSAPPNIKDLQYFAYNNDFANIKNNLDSWSKKNIATNLDISNINYTTLEQCYGNNNISNLILTQNDQNNVTFKNNNIIYPNVCYSSGYKWISSNSNFEMIITNSGEFMIRKFNETTSSLWKTQVSGGSSGKLCMQKNGNLGLYNSTNKLIWESKTSSNNNAYGELLSTGQLVIESSKGDIIECLNKITLDNIKSYYDIFNANRIQKVFFEFKEGSEKLLNDPACIYPYINYSNNFTWIKNNFLLRIQTDGNLVIYKDNIDSKNAIWSSNTKSTNAYLRLENDGNLIIYNTSNNVIWNSNTKGLDVMIRYAELTDKGFLVINNQNNNILKIYPEKFEILDMYLKNVFYTQSIDWIFSDYRGYAFPVNVDNQSWKDNLKKVEDSTIDDSSTGLTEFRGIIIDEDDSFWDVNELNLKNSYSEIIKDGKTMAIIGIRKEFEASNVKPDKNNNDNNWYRKRHRTEFINDSKNIKPINLGGGSRCNYIPGYERISNISGGDLKKNTSKWLLMDVAEDDYAFILYKKKSNQEFSTEIKEDNKDLIKDIIMNDKELKYIIQIYIGSNKDFANPYRNNLLKKYNISTFSNNFSNKLNLSLLENYENPQCNLENILTDSNCNSLEIDIYKNYINNMNEYCNKNWMNSINSNCIDYYNKTFTDSKGNKVSIDVPGKLKLLDTQEKTCMNDNYFLNDKCIELNYLNPSIINYQAKLCLDIKNKTLCDELNTKYTNIAKKSISESNGELLYKNELEKNILYNTCLDSKDIVTNKCNRLINDTNISEYNKDILIANKKNACLTNINQQECNTYIKENTELLNKITENCKDSNSSECKTFCKNNKDDEEFKKTDFYKEVCYSWVEDFWWVILLIVLAILGGGFFYFKKKNKTNTTINNNISTNNVNIVN